MKNPFSSKARYRRKEREISKKGAKIEVDIMALKAMEYEHENSMKSIEQEMDAESSNLETYYQNNDIPKIYEVASLLNDLYTRKNELIEKQTIIKTRMNYNQVKLSGIKEKLEILDISQRKKVPFGKYNSIASTLV